MDLSGRRHCLLAVCLCFCLNFAAANVNEDDNKEAAAALCGILELGAGRAKITPSTGLQTATYDEIQDLNMSLADAAWRSLFRDPSNQDNFRGFPTEEFGESTDWKDKWEEWKNSATRLKEEAVLKQKLKAAGLEGASPSAMRHAQEIIAEIAEAAAHLRRTTEEATKGKIIDQQAVQQKIDEAIYGEKIADEKAFGRAKVFNNAGGSRQANCEGNIGENKASTTLATLICLCAADNNGQTGSEHKACSGQTAVTQQWSGAAAPEQTTVTEMIQLCDTKDSHQITATALQTRLEAVARQLRIINGAAYYGKFVAGNCNGEQGGGLCVKYTDINNNAGKGFNSIPWVDKLRQLREQLEEHERAATKIEQTNTALNCAAAATKAIGRRVQLREAAGSNAAEPVVTQKSAKSEGKQKECNAAGDDPKKCKDLEGKGCTYDEAKPKGQKCTLSEDAKKEVQQTAEKAAGTVSKNESKCGDKKTEGDCKDGCKWENNACKDSSILLNNQFALSVVSAAFAALLF
uniref:ILTat 1.61 metacyclic VSG protein n=1 Tax=Trypanosoma brucei TaxID=5691 RepID=O97352_9TRYP|nr:ILTat 1.61 metacyclic VSG [Trypanosoma brucei]